jgi:hypothetical protein
VAVAEDHLGEPEWPEQTFQELFRLGFKRRTVDSLEHPVFKQLRGECEPSDEGLEDLPFREIWMVDSNFGSRKANVRIQFVW